MSDAIIEIEKKYRAPKDLLRLENLLRDRGATEGVAEQQVDIYYNVPGRDSYATKECLRIRSKNKHHEITYKAPSTAEDRGGLYAKREIDVVIEKPEVAQDLLAAIGCEVLAEVNKNRKTFELDNITVAVDTIFGLGSFIEIEALVPQSERSQALTRIDSLATFLGFTDLDLEPRPYRDLVMEVDSAT